MLQNGYGRKKCNSKVNDILIDGLPFVSQFYSRVRASEKSFNPPVIFIGAVVKPHPTFMGNLVTNSYRLHQHALEQHGGILSKRSPSLRRDQYPAAAHKTGCG